MNMLIQIAQCSRPSEQISANQNCHLPWKKQQSLRMNPLTFTSRLFVRHRIKKHRCIHTMGRTNVLIWTRHHRTAQRHSTNANRAHVSIYAKFRARASILSLLLPLSPLFIYALALCFLFFFLNNSTTRQRASAHISTVSAHAHART